MAKPKFKYGSYQEYANLQSISATDDNTLYFITDRGLVFKGDQEVTKHITIYDRTLNTNTPSITITDNTTNVNGIPSRFDVYTTSAITALLAAHAALVANNQSYGHVKLTDDYEAELNAASGGTAATPVAVQNAVVAANSYTDIAIQDALSEISGAMVFKGTIGTADAWTSGTYDAGDLVTKDGILWRCTTDGTTATPATGVSGWENIGVSQLPATGYSSGWMYKCVTDGQFAGKSCNTGDSIIAVNDYDVSTASNDDWVVISNDVDGNVFTEDTLDNNQLILGAGTTQVKKLAATASNAGQYLMYNGNTPVWNALLNQKQGFDSMECIEIRDSGYITRASRGFMVKENGIFSVYFPHRGVTESNAFLNLQYENQSVVENGILNMIYGSASMPTNVIQEGDTATFMIVKSSSQNEYDALLLATDRVNPSLMSQLTNNVSGLAQETSMVRNLVYASLSGFELQNNSIVSVAFTDNVGAGYMLNINGTDSKYIYHRGQQIAANVILVGDIATFVYDGTQYNLIAIDRPIDISATQGSNNLITSGAVYSAMPQWEPISVGGQ